MGLQVYVVAFAMRLLSILRHEGYLPYDSSGDWFYHFVEFTSLGAACLSVYQLLYKYRGTYDDGQDAFGNLHIPSSFGVAWIVLPCFLFAALFHPSLNKDWL